MNVEKKIMEVWCEKCNIVNIDMDVVDVIV